MMRHSYISALYSSGKVASAIIADWTGDEESVLNDHYKHLLPRQDQGNWPSCGKKIVGNRDLPNWRDQVDDLLEGKQIFVRNLRQFNSIYVAAKRKTSSNTPLQGFRL
jgi:hypothetical protein